MSKIEINSKSKSKSKKMPTALIIVDVQCDFAKQTGALYVQGGEAVATEINRLRAELKADLVVNTQDMHPANHVSFAANNPGTKVHDVIKLIDGTEQHMWPNHCVEGSIGATFVEDLVVLSTDVIIQKGRKQGTDSYSGFGSADGQQEVTPLLQVLSDHGITTVVVVGLAYDYCVAYTVKDACKRGFRTCVVKSACRSVSSDSAASEEKEMLALGAAIVDDISGAMAFVASA